MAPSHSRQLLVWTLPTIAVILSYLWYKRKRIGDKTDPGDTSKITIEDTKIAKSQLNKSRSISQPNTPIKTRNSGVDSPVRVFSRSLSGVDSTPIDIVFPPELKSSKSNPVVISDEDLDQHIEKLNSMRYGADPKKQPDAGTETVQSSSVTPKKEDFTPMKVANNTTPISTSASKRMAQKITDDKLSVPKENSLKDATAGKSIEASPKKEEQQLQRRNSGRDSANHSPADVMLASPSLSSISDNHSEGSNDSGKGGSDVVTPPPSRTPGADADPNAITVYEFIIAQTLVGKLIGKHGSFVSMIKNKTGAHVVVRKHPTNNKLKVCMVEGSQKEINTALKLIRDKFPLKRFPDVSLEQVSFLPEVSTVSLIPDHLYLKLIEGINNDTILSCMVSPNHLFLQQPTHPTFPNLNILTNYMNICYAEAESPLLPTPIPENTICAAYSVNSWYRVMILSTDEDSNMCYVKFLDYGGYVYVENSNLRQIRGDFMLLPFQAAECFLSNVKPIGDGGWSEDAYTAVADMTKGAIIYTQVADYTEEGVPLVYCYVVLGPQQVVFLNQELVNKGFAEWINSGEEASGVAVVVA